MKKNSSKWFNCVSRYEWTMLLLLRTNNTIKVKRSKNEKRTHTFICPQCQWKLRMDEMGTSDDMICVHCEEANYREEMS